MIFKHVFRARLDWSKDSPPLSSSSGIYSKNHRISIQDKVDLRVSAAKAFKGDPALYNPEDLLLSSLVSCHMMSYHYVCSKHHIELVSYTDEAEATLETHKDGSGRFIKVTLNPHVCVTDPNKIQLALALHAEASKLCFIANSCNFPIIYNPTCASI